MKTIHTQQNDTISAVCWREYGTAQGMVEKVLQVNKHLLKLPAILPIGTKIKLPPVNDRNSVVVRESLKLWD